MRIFIFFICCYKLRVDNESYLVLSILLIIFKLILQNTLNFFFNEISLQYCKIIYLMVLMSLVFVVRILITNNLALRSVFVLDNNVSILIIIRTVS